MTTTELKPLSQTATDVLDAIIDNPGKTAIDLATILSVSVGSVSGAVGSLKKRSLITIEDGKITATADAKFDYGDGDTTVRSTTPLGADTNKAAELEIADDLMGNEDTTAVLATAPTETIKASVAIDLAAMASPAPAPAASAPGPAVVSKASKAQAIFDANKDQPRKVLMNMLMDPALCGLSEAGANTYIYNMRKKAGMVTARGATPVATEAAPTAVTEAATPAFVVETTESVVVAAAAIEPTEAVVVEVAPVAETTEVVETTETPAAAE